MTYFPICVGQDSVVGTVTCYGLDGQGIETQWGVRFSAPTRPPIQWVLGRSLSGGLSGWDTALATHPHLVPRLRKE